MSLWLRHVTMVTLFMGGKVFTLIDANLKTSSNVSQSMDNCNYPIRHNVPVGNEGRFH